VGCISNVRLVIGTAVYTGNFTPPTAPLTAITNTAFLSCQSSTFIDNSTNNFTITANGNVQPVTSPTPFPAKVDTTTLNSAYSTSLIGGSGYFDGTGDYLSGSGNTNLNFGTGNFTVEMFVYVIAYPGSSISLFIGGGNASGGDVNINLYVGTNGYVGATFDGTGEDAATAAGVIKTGNWQHVALVRTSNLFTIYIDGVSRATGSTSSASTLYSTSGWFVGGAATYYLNGYVSGVRVLKGTALYTQNFAPPIAPPTAITNTQLLLNYTNGAIFDNTAKINLETAGNAQISTTQSKFGGSSMYFDGTGDFLATGKAPILDGIGGDFTIEYWQYPVTGSNGQYCVLGSAVSSYTGNASSFVYVPSTNNFYSVFNTTAGPNYTGGSYLNTWTHVAWVRSGSGSNNCTLYLNGVSVATSTYTGTLNLNTTNSNTYIGKNGWDASYLFTGYLDDLRITLAARYKANFTPPTSQLQDQ
jgi:hypothetical protein